MKRLLGATALACLFFAVPASASVTCSYERAAPNGLRGNYLKIAGEEIEDQAAIRRLGQLIRVTDDRTGAPVSCSGLAPTTINIDRIVFVAEADGAGLFVSLGGGKFEPGATNTGQSSEIQIVSQARTRFPGNIGIGGTPRGDHFSMSRMNPGALTRVNLDRAEDQAANFLISSSVIGLLVRSGRGSDTISAAGIRGQRLSLSVYAGPGRDRVIGGPGPDLLFGRRGADFIRSREGPDEVGCGPGNDVALIERRDRTTGCESRRIDRSLLP